MTTGIYYYYDNLNCEIIYIGKDSHIDENRRHKQHYQPSKRDEQQINKILQNDNKSGRYSYAILEQGNLTNDELNQKEISWIEFFDPRFNFTEGGDGASSGEKHHFYGKTGYWKDKKFSKEHCEKISRANSGEKNPMYGKTGKKHPRFNPCIKIRKEINDKCKQGFRWIAQVYTPKKRESFQSVDLQKCIEKVENFIKSNDNVYGYTKFKIVK